jgi:hypothetical protein
MRIRQSLVLCRMDQPAMGLDMREKAEKYVPNTGEAVSR